MPPNRIRRIRAYSAAQSRVPETALQVVALSATSSASAANSYASPLRVIQVPGGRALEAECYALAPDNSSALHDYLESFRRRGWRKALVFCNSRLEVEAYAAATRTHSPFGSAVYVHYSNLEPQRRRTIEKEFAANEAAICFSSNTLELGIDIGSIDVVLLIGPPGSPASFAQRIGRGNRRRGSTRVACFYRNALEELLFTALIKASQTQLSEDEPLPAALTAFRPSVTIQQIFSLIKQSPTAALRLAELNALFTNMLTPNHVQDIVAELRRRDYLQDGRPGEWRAGTRLNKLYDEQIGTQVSLSIYSNIQVNAAHMLEVRDQHTGETVARVESSWFQRDVMTLEGRAVNVEWYDGEALWVSSYQGQDLAREPGYRSTRQLLSYELAQLLPGHLGLPAAATPYVAAPKGGWYWFHWLGDLYGCALLDLLGYTLIVHETAAAGLALHLPEHIPVQPDWSAERVVHYLRDSYRQYEPLLELGPFQSLLPISQRRRSVIEQFDVARFLAAVNALQPLAAPEKLAAQLAELLTR